MVDQVKCAYCQAHNRIFRAKLVDHWSLACAIHVATGQALCQPTLCIEVFSSMQMELIKKKQFMIVEWSLAIIFINEGLLAEWLTSVSDVFLN